MSQKPTLRDVAALAGVHYGTASRALRADTSHLVSSVTVTRVREAADRLHYTADVIAQSLRTSKTMTIGIVIPDIANPTTGSLTRGAQDALTSAGYVSLVVSTDHDRDHEQQQIDALLSRQVEGLILANTDSPTVQFEDIVSAGTPVVMANRGRSTKLTTVNAGVGEGIRQAVEHLVSLGHQRIAFIGASRDTSTGRDRHIWFEHAVAACGVRPADWTVRFSDDFGLEEGTFLMHQLLTDDTEPTAVIAANDVMAIGALAALREAGIGCPSDISLVGANDMPFMAFLDPPLTTIRVPHYDLGRAAAESLLQQLDGVTVSSQVLPVQFVIRGSTAPPRRNTIEGM